MIFYEIDPMAFPKGAQFFFNIVIATIEIPIDAPDLPIDIMDYWYLGGIKESQPFAIHIYRNPEKYVEEEPYCAVETYTHCVLELDPDQTICWYEMVDYDTEDPWDPTPILEDFDDDDDDYDDYE